MDTLTGMKRTDYCGNFTTEQIGQEVTVYGWAQRQRRAYAASMCWLPPAPCKSERASTKS